MTPLMETVTNIMATFGAFFLAAYTYRIFKNVIIGRRVLRRLLGPMTPAEWKLSLTEEAAGAGYATTDLYIMHLLTQAGVSAGALQWAFLAIPADFEKMGGVTVGTSQSSGVTR